MSESKPVATELEFLRYFAQNADFGPANSDVQIWLRQKFEEDTGKLVPKDWCYE